MSGESSHHTVIRAPALALRRREFDGEGLFGRRHAVACRQPDQDAAEIPVLDAQLQLAVRVAPVNWNVLGADQQIRVVVVADVELLDFQ